MGWIINFRSMDCGIPYGIAPAAAAKLIRFIFHIAKCNYVFIDSSTEYLILSGCHRKLVDSGMACRLWF